MVVLDLSSAVMDAIDAILPNDGRHLVQRVHVSRGWGGTLFVNVYAGISEDDAGIALRGAILKVVAGVMDDRRHTVKIIWRCD